MESRRNTSKRNNAGKKNGSKLLIIILVILIIVAGVLFALKVLDKGQVETNANGEQIEEKKEEPKVQIVDVNSKTRPYAVMINNNHSA